MTQQSPFTAPDGLRTGNSTATPVSPAQTSAVSTEFKQAIYLRLALLGCPLPEGVDFPPLLQPLLARHQEDARRLSSHLCPADWRIQQFLDEYLYEAGGATRLPARTFVLDRPGFACALSLPSEGDEFSSDIVRSYRLRQGVLHNPASDRRTTQGVFHISEGGLPIPDDKCAVPKSVFGRLLKHALSPPRELLELPFTHKKNPAAACFVSLLLRPLVCPEVPGFTVSKSMEIRFFAPGNLVSNLDFVERIFGNAGDPNLPENDAGLDSEHWTGHTGCVLLAPHLVRLTKKELGLPPFEEATDRQKRDGMCWKSADEPYNGGQAFKICARDERGVMVTLIADNYYGYCKKEVKTQISYSANLYGLVEEEHAGGALVYASFDLGEEFSGKTHVRARGHNAAEMFRLNEAFMEARPEGYAIDRSFPHIIYVPEEAEFRLKDLSVTWTWDGKRRRLQLLPGHTYVRPSGYKIRLMKPPGNRAWRLIGITAEPTFCHKPCTVSGGGKSEISKPLTDAILQGPVFVADFQKDFDAVETLIHKDYSQRFKDDTRNNADRRAILDSARSLGSVIKLLTPSENEYSGEYNSWVASVPQHVKELVFVVKRFYRPEWGKVWREHFSVDVINGVPGNELKCEGRKLAANYLRVGFESDGSWRVFGLRKDFYPSTKLQTEDDITVSVVVPSDQLSHLNPIDPHPSVKFAVNVERQLFQRPDDAIHRGYDRQTERDLSQPGNFLSNFEPMPRETAKALIDDAIGFTQFTEPMQNLILGAASGDGPSYFASSAHPRLVDGKPSKNPRYLQTRPDLLAPEEVHLAEMGTRLARRIAAKEPVYTPVNAVIPGRRNNPPEAAAGIRSLAVFNPLHLLELPEAFMEFISSMTGRSPSTTGAGSEGALTKGPFNALPPIYDLNSAYCALVLTGYHVFLSSAGYVGPRYRVDHDISLLVPEVWARTLPSERDPKYLVEHGLFEPLRDFEHKGSTVLASRLGYRMTAAFVHRYFGRIFSSPHVVFTDEMLRPEKQDLETFVDGVHNILETHRRVALSYFADGSVDLACPPLKILLHLMRDGVFEGRSLNDARLRAQFTREHMLASDWYSARLQARQVMEQALWLRHARYLETFVAKDNYSTEAERLGVPGAILAAWEHYHDAKSPKRLERLRGTIGGQPGLQFRSRPRSASQFPMSQSDPNRSDRGPSVSSSISLPRTES